MTKLTQLEQTFINTALIHYIANQAKQDLTAVGMAQLSALKDKIHYADEIVVSRQRRAA